MRTTNSGKSGVAKLPLLTKPGGKAQQGARDPDGPSGTGGQLPIKSQSPPSGIDTKYTVDDAVPLSKHFVPIESATAEDAYSSVVGKIGSGTVSVDDFNILLEATARSTDERTYRHVRPTNPEPAEMSHFGRIVPKREGHNDPPRQGRGRRYASGTPAKERQNEKQRREKLREAVERALSVLRTAVESSARPESLVAAPVSPEAVVGLRRVVGGLLLDESARNALGFSNVDWLYSVLALADEQLIKYDMGSEKLESIHFRVSSAKRA